MPDENSKQKETIHFLDSMVNAKAREVVKQKEVILMQGKSLGSTLAELEKAKEVIRLQDKLLRQTPKKREFDEEVYLFELFSFGRLQPYKRLVSQTALSYTTNTPKNREKVKAFREKLERLNIIKRTSNETISIVDFEEATRILEKTKNDK